MVAAATICHTAPIIGHAVMFTLFCVYSFGTFFQLHKAHMVGNSAKVMVLQPQMNEKIDRYPKHSAAATLIGRPMTIDSSGLWSERKRIQN
jgi:hypothetical protein